MRATDSVNSTLNNLKFCTPLTNLIKMFGIETRVLSYEAHRTTISTILHFGLLKSAGLQRRIHKSRLITNVKIKKKTCVTRLPIYEVLSCTVIKVAS